MQLAADKQPGNLERPSACAVATTPLQDRTGAASTCCSFQGCLVPLETSHAVD
jgi:hypothetical protein